MNPYAPQLGNHDPVAVIEATSQKLEALIDELGLRRIDEPRAPGKWSAKQIVSHLADCELTFAFRLRQTLAEDHHVIQPFDQEKWAATYSAYNAEAALAVFSSVRQWNLALIRSSIPAALPKPVTHPERGQMTFATILETMAGHDLNHIHQIEAIAARVVGA
ncbi:MAG: DinB family protein [Bryobacteraceae bacterium]|jgi:uncharacterized damage-inducible protein DinB